MRNSTTKKMAKSAVAIAAAYEIAYLLLRSYYKHPNPLRYSVGGAHIFVICAIISATLGGAVWFLTPNHDVEDIAARNAQFARNSRPTQPVAPTSQSRAWRESKTAVHTDEDSDVTTLKLAINSSDFQTVSTTLRSERSPQDQRTLLYEANFGSPEKFESLFDYASRILKDRGVASVDRQIISAIKTQLQKHPSSVSNTSTLMPGGSQLPPDTQQPSGTPAFNPTPRTHTKK